MPANAKSPAEQPAQEEVSVFQIFILILSVYVLVAFVFQTLCSPDSETVQLLDEIDVFVCGCFIVDFFARLIKAPDKWSFLKWGWIDLVSSIPVFPFFEHLRILRLIRLFRILRALRSTTIISHFLFRNRARNGVISVVLISLLVAIFAAIAELNLEKTPDANIITSSDALWWAFSTVTTVACEKYPVTDGGRVIGFLLMVAGVCLFGTIAAYISTVFMEPIQKVEETEVLEVLEEVRQLRSKIQELEETNQKILAKLK